MILKSYPFILICIWLTLNLNSQAQDKKLLAWTNELCRSLEAGSNLQEYSAEPIDEDVIVNFYLVEQCKLVSLSDSTLKVEIDHGKGSFCTLLTFSYIKRKKQYFLRFSEVKSTTIAIINKEKKFQDPWIKSVRLCD